MERHPDSAVRIPLRSAAGALTVPASAAPVFAPGRAAAEEVPGPVPESVNIPGIVKPLPAQWFVQRDTNAEMRWESLRDADGEAVVGRHVPVERFFVRNHTSTPLIDPVGWRLKLFGSGLRGAPSPERAVEFALDDLRALPATGIHALIECAGNGRSYFHRQQGRLTPGTPWTLGSIGSASWRGVRLAEVLRAAGLTDAAVDVLPTGLDPDYVVDGTDYGPVRRPLPIAKALDDTLLAYEMNDEPLTPDHGAPVRLVVPGWVGIASIKWVGSIEVADHPLHSPWNTVFYRMYGPGHPPGGGPALTTQVVKSAFELAEGARLEAGREHRLHGRSWSGTAPVRQVEVSTDGGLSWRTAELAEEPCAGDWTRWSTVWRPERPGRYELRARATDRQGATQPEREAFNREGYLFGAVVAHPVTVV
ncbi:sulfite oxidase [Kitasatospora aureofaciens]|uniref:Sulfite oxidase n=1 Tax=Kitasatospora aureofaciens TaxID=1894 RepID=A0A1E7ND69_KITAU|nr:sulfite oxidase [Kitasatospora aureofaciens]OEV38640.1 sulfite oxidase [Kitasatospora aureofaciens]UKZ04872.1 sulfite oxidase [Streptomyces viridifaciens]GGU74852.1 sulfite oxidase [Kitasatospora aureofaciens]